MPGIEKNTVDYRQVCELNLLGKKNSRKTRLESQGIPIISCLPVIKIQG